MIYRLLSRAKKLETCLDGAFRALGTSAVTSVGGAISKPSTWNVSRIKPFSVAGAQTRRAHLADAAGRMELLRHFSSQKERFISEDYVDYARKREKKLRSVLESPSRFQRISEREDRSDLNTAEYLKAQCMGKRFISHRGCQLLKTAEDIVTHQQLLWYLRPVTVIELGAFTGGSAIWMADMLQLMDVKSRIFSMDINLSQIEDRVKELKPDNVTFLQGDSYAIEKTFTEDFLKDLPHPWLVIDDAHINIYSVLEYFDAFMETGDYFIVEDLNPNLSTVWEVNESVTEIGPSGLGILRKFLTDYSDKYAVDSFYTDFFGYNVTWHWHGYIRHM